MREIHILLRTGRSSQSAFDVRIRHVVEPSSLSEKTISLSPFWWRTFPGEADTSNHAHAADRSSSLPLDAVRRAIHVLALVAKRQAIEV